MEEFVLFGGVVYIFQGLLGCEEPSGWRTIAGMDAQSHSACFLAEVVLQFR